MYPCTLPHCTHYLNAHTQNYDYGIGQGPQLESHGKKVDQHLLMLLLHQHITITYRIIIFRIIMNLNEKITSAARPPSKSSN